MQHLFRVSRNGVLFTLGLIVLAVVGCKSKVETGTSLAKVGESSLTLEEVRRIFPPEYEQLLPRDQYLDYVKRWIDDEVIYQQALKAGLEKDSGVVRKVEEIRRKMLIEEFLQRENAGSAVEPDAMALTQYYEMHREEFRRKVAEYRYLALRVKSLKEAMELKPKLRGEDMLQIAAPHLLDPLPENLESIPFRKAAEATPCLQSALANAPINQITGPLTCPEGIILLKVLARAEAGSLIPFNDAKDHIAGTMLMERKDKLREGIIAKYKDGVLISFNLEKIPGRETVVEDNSPSPEAPAVGNTPDEDGPVNKQDVGQNAGEPGAVAKARKHTAPPVLPPPPNVAEDQPTAPNPNLRRSNSATKSSVSKPESSSESPQDMNGSNEAP